MKTNILILVLMLGNVACNKEEKACQPPKLDTNLLGQWEASFEPDSKQMATVTFSKNGTYEEDGDLLLGSYYSPKGSWLIRNDSIFISAMYSNGSKTTYSFSMVANACEEIVLSLEDIKRLRLRRK